MTWWKTEYYYRNLITTAMIEEEMFQGEPDTPAAIYESEKKRSHILASHITYD